VRRITREGFNPSWSADGAELVYGEESVTADPTARAGQGSRLRAVSIQSGESRLLTPSDGVQPSWSPHGQRVAYWAIEGDLNQRDIWTVSAKGGEPVRVTSDAAVDWSPAWSPDGRHLYFSSNGSGAFAGMARRRPAAAVLDRIGTATPRHGDERDRDRLRIADGIFWWPQCVGRCSQFLVISKPQSDILMATLRAGMF
jgi:WD40 repeat protein